MTLEIWDIDSSIKNSQQYIGNKILAHEISKKGYNSIIHEYVYIDSINVEKILNKIPKLSELIYGVGIDLGGGVGCISSTIARRDSVEMIYCVEIVEEVVRLCQPIVKKEILKTKSDKVVSVVGDFDHLQIENDSIDFAISWDALHHSNDVVKTLKECKRVLKKNGTLIIVDRAHNDSISNSEIEKMKNIQYDKEFLIKTYRNSNIILKRKDYDEHEYRFFEWKNFFQESGFELLENIIIKRKSDMDKNLENDNDLKKISVDFPISSFGNQKSVFVLRQIS